MVASRPEWQALLKGICGGMTPEKLQALAVAAGADDNEVNDLRGARARALGARELAGQVKERQKTFAQAKTELEAACRELDELPDDVGVIAHSRVIGNVQGRRSCLLSSESNLRSAEAAAASIANARA